MNTRTVYVLTPDGAALATDVCLPDGARPRPAVVIRTPYGRDAHRAELRGWAAHGFAALAQDVRGRHGSPGEWHPYRGHERTDGAATVAWVRAQVWSNGEVVAAGASYAAHCALVTALAAPDEAPRDRALDDAFRDGIPDAVIAAVPALGLSETAREPGGPERLWARTGWWASHGDRRDSDPDALARALADDPRLLEHLPIVRLAERLAEGLGRELPSWPGLWTDRGRGRLVELGATARLPLLAVGGTRDPFAEDTVALWHGWGGPARLLLGPWGHRLTADPAAPARARVNLGALYVRWARAALADRLEPTRHGVIALGDSGRWHSTWVRRAPRAAINAAATRPEGVEGLEGAGSERRPAVNAGTAPDLSPGNHRDRRTAPARATAPVPPPAFGPARTVAWPFGSPSGLRLLHGAEFSADPDRPVRSDNLAVPVGGDRADRCLLLSPPLPRPLDLAGAAVARINVTADAPCADWAVRLTALDPSGRADPLAFGIVRRTGPPGEAADITVPLGTLGRRLPAGTRLRAEIAGHHFPAHARNPHTGEDPVTATRLAPSRRTVNPRGSALHLPVVARRRYVEPVPEICR
ncbi:CocE/NonD family hydrolase [Streptomyces sp. SM11]|uniref:CocE/NonD family hydrolase n=1 Tax=Streptomyces sp. SM11 TaxID=565557 RepID=UPI000CD54E64|nr:CocE/NonD family hydrolase [Streptomyces sp. SM11]